MGGPRGKGPQVSGPLLGFSAVLPARRHRSIAAFFLISIASLSIFGCHSHCVSVPPSGRPALLALRCPQPERMVGTSACTCPLKVSSACPPLWGTLRRPFGGGG